MKIGYLGEAGAYPIYHYVGTNIGITRGQDKKTWTVRYHSYAKGADDPALLPEKREYGDLHEALLAARPFAKRDLERKEGK